MAGSNAKLTKKLRQDLEEESYTPAILIKEIDYLSTDRGLK